MQGMFQSTFKGKKKDIDRLIEFIKSKAESKSENSYMYLGVSSLIELPKRYFELDNEEIIEIMIGMEESCHINWFADSIYFNDVVKAVPELEMKGFDALLDFPGQTNYSSPAGSSEVEENVDEGELAEYIFINTELELSGFNFIDLNIDNELKAYLQNEKNEIIRSFWFDNDENSIFIYGEDCGSDDLEYYKTFKDDMIALCSKISNKYPSCKLSGYFGIVDEYYRCGEFHLYVFSEKNSSQCNVAENIEDLNTDKCILAKKEEFSDDIIVNK